MTRQYLEGLHSLRFFAAFFVLIGHCNHNLSLMDIHWHHRIPLLHKGDVAVDFFFVLSGFLLSYLAFFEFRQHHSIDISKFFRRRILRIFPLYYLAVALGFFLLGFIYPKLTGEAFFSFNLWEGLLCYLLFLPNLVIAFGGDSIGSIYSLWSIGVEEQFYLFFPFIVIFTFGKRNCLWYWIALFIIYSLFYFSLSANVFSGLDPIAIGFISTLRFHYMFAGAVAALLFVRYQDQIHYLLEKKLLQLAIWVLMLLVFFTNLFEGIDTLEAIIFCLIILTASHNGKRIVNLEVSPLIYLGTISYGIYIFHPFVSYLLRFLMNKFQFLMHSVSTLPLSYYIAELLLTILIAHLSYKYYESYFLKKKKY